MHGDVVFDFNIIVVEKKEKGKILRLTIEHAMKIFCFDCDHRRSIKEKISIKFYSDVPGRRHSSSGIYDVVHQQKKRKLKIAKIFLCRRFTKTSADSVKLPSRNSRHIRPCVDDDECAMAICSENTF